MLMSTLLTPRWCQPCPDGAKSRRVGPPIDYHSQQMALPASTQKVITRWRR